MNITVVGLGKIGLPLAVQYASRGHKVFGADINQLVVDQVNAGQEPFPGEAMLDEKLKEQMHDLWIKLKSLGVQLSDPPLLFGLPANFGHESEEIPTDNDPEIEIKRHDPEEESGKRKPTRKGGNGGSSSSDEYSA